MDKKDKVITILLRLVKLDVTHIATFLTMSDSGHKATAFASLGELAAKRTMAVKQMIDGNGKWFRELAEKEHKETIKMLKNEKKKHIKMMTREQEGLNEALSGIIPNLEESEDTKRYIG